MGVVSPLQIPAASRLPADYAAGIVLFFVAIFAIHWARRAFRQPARTGAALPPEIPGSAVKAFDIVERLFHWSLFIVMGILVLTGVSLFVPGYFDFILSPLGIVGYSGNFIWHVDMVWVLLGLIAIHSVWDLAEAKGGSNIWVGTRDVKDVSTRLKNFFGISREFPKTPKYDIFMKTFHWALTVSLVVLGITGLYLWNPYSLLPIMAPSFEYTLRMLHDIFAFLTIGLIIGHVYFAVLPVNWPLLRAIFTGSLAKDAYNKEFDSERWPLNRETRPAAPTSAVQGIAAAKPEELE